MAETTTPVSLMMRREFVLLLPLPLLLVLSCTLVLMTRYSLHALPRAASSSDSQPLHLCFQVREWYVISYKEIRDFPRPITVDQEVNFAELLKVIAAAQLNTCDSSPTPPTRPSRLLLLSFWCRFSVEWGDNDNGRVLIVQDASLCGIVCSLLSFISSPGFAISFMSLFIFRISTRYARVSLVNDGLLLHGRKNNAGHQGIYQRHAPVLLTMARGVWELRESFSPQDAKRKNSNRFGDFYDFKRVRVVVIFASRAESCGGGSQGKQL